MKFEKDHIEQENLGPERQIPSVIPTFKFLYTSVDLTLAKKYLCNRDSYKKHSISKCMLLLGRASQLPYQKASLHFIYLQVTLYRLSRLYSCFSPAHTHTKQQQLKKKRT